MMFKYVKLYSAAVIVGVDIPSNAKDIRRMEVVADESVITHIGFKRMKNEMNSFKNLIAVRQNTITKLSRHVKDIQNRFVNEKKKISDHKKILRTK